MIWFSYGYEVSLTYFREMWDWKLKVKQGEVQNTEHSAFEFLKTINMDDIFTQVREGNAFQVRMWLDNTENDLNQGYVIISGLKMIC